MATSNTPLPVTVLTGFLGAGKTTLLNRLLRAQHGVRLGVLVNDFGAINVDARLVDIMQKDSVTLTNGCVCCSLRGDLLQSTVGLLERADPPEHLIIEASGIADPVAIASVFRTPALRDRTRLDGIIALVDAENARNPRLDAQLIRDQIRSADIVVLNKVDLIPGSLTVELNHWIHDLAPWARIVEAVNADVPLIAVLGLEERRRHGAPDGGMVGLDESAREDTDHSRAFGSWSYRSCRPLAYGRVRAALESFPTSIFRAKGILALADAPLMRFSLQMVGRRISIDLTRPWDGERPETEIVCIGSPNAIMSEDVTRRFDACITDSVPLMSSGNFTRLRRAVASRSLDAVAPSEP